MARARYVDARLALCQPPPRCCAHITRLAGNLCRESHPDVRSGALQPPSRTVLMSTQEFVDRLSSNRAGRTPLLYGDDERCYLQALAPHAMMADVDFAFLDYASQPPPLLDDDDDGNEEDGDEGTPNLFGGEEDADDDVMVAEESGGGGTGVLGRLWVSAPGTVSPLHYDLTDSYLCQVRGVKRLLLWRRGTSRASSRIRVTMRSQGGFRWT